MCIKISRALTINTLCAAVGILLAINIPLWLELWRVLPPFVEEIRHNLDMASRSWNYWS